ncbi:MAG: ABC-F family ATP-binding cassette domain-containing protein, partial [Proteobacteria bacterium]|nr:ABC-F family ATP-binding cassette domain-containing protein [Pseudomonadota bacterium]
MISLNNISKHYSGEYLFKDVSLYIGDRERLAIVGSNGSGKTTLMKIMVGQIESDSGRVSQSRSNTVGYLPQDGVYHRGKTLLDEAATAFDDVLLLQQRIAGINREIAVLTEDGDPQSAALHELLEELGKIQHHIEHREGYSIETRVKQILSGLGFSERDFSRMTDEFSGGWQMRIELAKHLLREPAILLLDEPTNHLDLESLEWLEAYLRSYDGSIVLVSHDRRFLNTLVERTIEISLGKLSEYSGNYSFYLKEKAQRRVVMEAAHGNQQQRIKQTMQFVERFRYKATKARQVQSRLKMLDKMELVEIEDEEKEIVFNFPQPQPSGRVVLELKNIYKSYGSLRVFEDMSLKIDRGDKIALLGVNGAGKSTLVRIMAGLEPFQAGTRTLGHNGAVSYFAQHQADELDPHKTVLETVEGVAGNESGVRLRTLLGSFLFTGDDVFKKVAVLSGGEKSRLALARMLLLKANFLILDEPTNHLDMQSKAVLQQALYNFNGSSVIVSHDRDFLEPLITKVIDVQDGALRVMLGSVDDYLEKLHTEQQDRYQLRDTSGHIIQKKGSQHREKLRKREEAENRQERYRMLK